jgi:hypothetical protein
MGSGLSTKTKPLPIIKVPYLLRFDPQKLVELRDHAADARANSNYTSLVPFYPDEIIQDSTDCEYYWRDGITTYDDERQVISDILVERPNKRTEFMELTLSKDGFVVTERIITTAA